jgi:hypothetical protein
MRSRQPNRLTAQSQRAGSFQGRKEYPEPTSDLPGSMLTEFLDLSKTQSQTVALAAFRQRIRSRKTY